MLAGALAHYESALRASLRAAYGVNLSSPGMPFTDLADLVIHLPPGCALWRATGGPLAWPDEVAALHGVTYGLAVLAWQNSSRDKSKYPKPPEPPPFAHEAEARKQRDMDRGQKLIDRKRARARAREVTTTDT
jgi:hypothetical protein